MSVADSRRVYLGLGSNIGDRDEALREAVRRIDQIAGTDVLRSSSVYETEPWGGIPQDAYLNAAVEIRTVLQTEALLNALLEIESSMGRERDQKYGPRRIDIDILFFGDLVLEHVRLNVPHARIAERNFVLVPLEELDPDLLHPVLQRTIAELRVQCTDTGDIRKTGIRLWPDTATT